MHVADEVAARVHTPQGAKCSQVAEGSIQRPGRALVLILVIGRLEGDDLIATQIRAVRGLRIVVEIALRIHVLVVLLNEHVPVVVDLQQPRDPQAVVGHRVGVVGDQCCVANRGAAGICMRNTADGDGARRQ